MKNYITRFLKSVAIFHLIFPIGYIILAAMLFDIPFSKCVGVLLSPFYYVVTLTAVAAGYGLWEMRRWSWYLFVLTQVLVCYENAVLVHGYAESHHKVLVFISSILLQLILIYRVSGEVRVPYFFPKIRWWESNPNYRLSVPAQLSRQAGPKVDGEILDLSIAGCFVKLRENLTSHDRVVLKFNIYGHELHLSGTVVWCAESAVTHPKGVGLKFHQLSRAQRKSLRHVTKTLKKVSHHYRRSRYLMSQEEFLKQLKNIEAGLPE